MPDRDGVTLDDLRAAVAADLPRGVLWSMWLRLPGEATDIGLALIEDASPTPVAPVAPAPRGPSPSRARHPQAGQGDAP